MFLSTCRLLNIATMLLITFPPPPLLLSLPSSS